MCEFAMIAIPKKQIHVNFINIIILRRLASRAALKT